MNDHDRLPPRVVLNDTSTPVTDRASFSMIDVVGGVAATVMALGPLTVFAIFRGAGYSL